MCGAKWHTSCLVSADNRGEPMLDDLARDIIYGLRIARRNPEFTTACRC